MWGSCLTPPVWPLGPPLIGVSVIIAFALGAVGLLSACSHFLGCLVFLGIQILGRGETALLEHGEYAGLVAGDPADFGGCPLVCCGVTCELPLFVGGRGAYWWLVPRWDGPGSGRFAWPWSLVGGWLGDIPFQLRGRVGRRYGLFIRRLIGACLVLHQLVIGLRLVLGCLLSRLVHGRIGRRLGLPIHRLLGACLVLHRLVLGLLWHVLGCLLSRLVPGLRRRVVGWYLLLLVLLLY